MTCISTSEPCFLSPVFQSSHPGCPFQAVLSTCHMSMAKFYIAVAKKKKKIWSQKKWFQKYPTSASKKRSSSRLGNEYIENHLNYSILLNSTFIWRVWLLSLATFWNYNPVYRITFAENLLFYFEHFLPWSWVQIKHVRHPYSADFLMNKQQ